MKIEKIKRIYYLKFWLLFFFWRLVHIEKLSKEVNDTLWLIITNVNLFAYFEIDGGYINNTIYTISNKNSDDIKDL